MIHFRTTIQHYFYPFRGDNPRIPFLAGTYNKKTGSGAKGFKYLPSGFDAMCMSQLYRYRYDGQV